MGLETVYVLGEVGILCTLIYYLYVGIRDKHFSIIPLILGLVAWFLSSFSYYEIVKSIGEMQTSFGNVTADVVGSAAILIGMNNYVLMFNILLTVVYVVAYIVWKVVEGARSWRSK